MSFKVKSIAVLYFFKTISKLPSLSLVSREGITIGQIYWSPRYAYSNSSYKGFNSSFGASSSFISSNWITLCCVRGFFTTLGTFILFVLPGVIHRAWSIYFIFCIQGLFTTNWEIYCMCCTRGLFIVLGAFISRDVLGSSSPNSRNLLHHHVGWSHVYTISGDRVGLTYHHGGMPPIQIYGRLVESQGAP